MNDFESVILEVSMLIEMSRGRIKALRLHIKDGAESELLQYTMCIYIRVSVGGYIRV